MIVIEMLSIHTLILNCLFDFNCLPIDANNSLFYVWEVVIRAFMIDVGVFFSLFILNLALLPYLCVFQWTFTPPFTLRALKSTIFNTILIDHLYMEVNPLISQPILTPKCSDWKHCLWRHLEQDPQHIRNISSYGWK